MKKKKKLKRKCKILKKLQNILQCSKIMLPCNLLQWLSGAVVYIFAHQAKCPWFDSFASGRMQKNQKSVFYQSITC